MFELLVVLCLAGDADRCGKITVLTNSCPVSLSHIMAAAPEGAVVSSLSCRRMQEIILPPMQIGPGANKERIRT